MGNPTGGKNGTPVKPPSNFPYEEWMSQGACNNKGTTIFFPDKGPGSGDRAKAICAMCEQRTRCYDYSLTHAVDGIWAGMTLKQRQAIRARKRLAEPAA